MSSLVRLSMLAYVGDVNEMKVVLRFLDMGNNIGDMEPGNTKVENCGLILKMTQKWAYGTCIFDALQMP
jgi:hypothetical protein